MNIVFATENSIPAHIIGWHNAADFLGNKSFIWFKAGKSAFDMYDEFKPDLLFNNTEIIDRALGKCQSLNGFKILGSHQYDKDGFDSLNFKVGQYDKNLECDVCYVGNYTPDKRTLWNKYLRPLTEKYNVKIFGQTAWPTPSYLGYLNNNRIPDLYKSAKVSLSFNDNEWSTRALNIMGCGGNLIMLDIDDNYEETIELIERYKTTQYDTQASVDIALEHSYIEKLKKILNEQT